MGVDFEETFSPTAHLTTIMVSMQRAVQLNMVLHQMDVKTACLRTPLNCETNMKQPES